MATRPADTPAVPARLCTVAATNYLPRVRVLAESVRRFGPGGDLSVFLIDDPEARTDTSGEAFDLLPLTRLPLDPEWFAAMTLYYDLTELATAVKPWVLEALAEPGGDPGGPAAVAYLDPDTELFAPLEDLWAIAAGGDIVLTPHALGPYPRDRRLMTERTLLQAGVFNLGFIALPATDVGRHLLRWWQERLRFDALVAPEKALFTDQRWMDLAATVFPCHLVDDPGVNVAYWNLHERPIARHGDTLTAGGAPLRLMHYSGIDPARPHLLSANQGHYPRILLSEEPELAALCERYLARIATTEPVAPYRWATLPNGLGVTAWMRERYRNELVATVEEHVGVHTCPPPPLGPQWLSELMDWWLEPAFPTMVPRLLDALFVQRPDLAALLTEPDPTANARALRRWLATSGVDDEGLTPAVALRLGEAIDTWATTTAAANRRGAIPDERIVNLLGIGGSASGLATSATQLARLFAEADSDHRALTLGHPHTTAGEADPPDIDLFTAGAPPPPADITVVGVNADTLSEIGAIGRYRLFGDSYRVGYWWWEVDRMPADYQRHLDLVDEVWVGTTHVAHLMRNLTDRPVHRVPLPVRQPAPTPVDRSALGIDGDTTLFTFAFDYNSGLARKNPLGLIEAWRAAFTPNDGCTLAIKTLNAELQRPHAEAVRHAARGRTDIVLIDRFLDADTLDGLVASSAAYVSLHRAEGLGLGILDATVLGVPVVATATGGCMDFLAADSSWLVPASPVPVGPHQAPYPPDATWGDPDPDVAVAHLRAIAADPVAARATAQLARSRALDTYDVGVCTDILRQRVADIRAQLDQQRSTSPAPTGVPG